MPGSQGICHGEATVVLPTIVSQGNATVDVSVPGCKVRDMVIVTFDIANAALPLNTTGNVIADNSVRITLVNVGLGPIVGTTIGVRILTFSWNQ